MKEQEDENLVEELVFDEDENEMQEEKIIYDKNGNEVGTIITTKVEELSDEETENVLGGGTKYMGKKYKTVTLRRVGQTVTVNPSSFLRGRLVNCRRFSPLVVSVSYGMPGIKITRKSTWKNVNTTILCEELQNKILHKGQYWDYKWDLYITVRCP